MVNKPLPESPTNSKLLLVQVEAVPLTLADPDAPVLFPRRPIELVTLPPLVIDKVPEPESPSERVPELVQVEPVPSIVATPVAPAL